MADGLLIGRDLGEFGGDLKFYPEGFAEGKNGIDLGLANVRELFCWNDKIYCLAGLAHLEMDYGGFYELSPENRWKKRLKCPL